MHCLPRRLCGSACGTLASVGEMTLFGHWIARSRSKDLRGSRTVSGILLMPPPVLAMTKVLGSAGSGLVMSTLSRGTAPAHSACLQLYYDQCTAAYACILNSIRRPVVRNETPHPHFTLSHPRFATRKFTEA